VISKEDCIDRCLYKINSRNLILGVYKQSTGGFLGIRTKFGSRFIFEEYHWDNGPPFGTVKPIEMLEDFLPENIENKESLGTVCQNCGKSCKYIDVPGGKEIKFQNGKSMFVSGEWKHLESIDCKSISPVSKENDKFFEWLLKMEMKYV